MFAIFIVAWIITRHVLYPILLWSVIFELPRLVPYDWRPRDGYFNSFASHHAFCGLLLALQVLILVWFTMICRVAYRAITGQGAVDDTRSEAGYAVLFSLAGRGHSSFPSLTLIRIAGRSRIARKRLSSRTAKLRAWCSTAWRASRGRRRRRRCFSSEKPAEEWGCNWHRLLMVASAVHLVSCAARRTLE